MKSLLNCDYIELLSDIKDESVDVVITDPPYGICYQNNYTQNKHKVLKSDNDKFSYSKLAAECFRVLKPNKAIFVFTGWSTYPDHFNELRSAGFLMKEPLICQKRPSGTTDLYGSFQTNSDWIMFAHKGRFKFNSTNLIRNKKAGIIPNLGRKPVPEWKTRFPSAWFGDEYPFSSENSSFQKEHGIFHPTIKGLKFIEWLIQLSTDEGNVVLDPFLGSGTTAVAALKLNRRIVGSEIDTDFYKLIEKRLT
jgi:DNA modification methylase